MRARPAGSCSRRRQSRCACARRWAELASTPRRSRRSRARRWPQWGALLDDLTRIADGPTTAADLWPSVVRKPRRARFRRADSQQRWAGTGPRPTTARRRRARARRARLTRRGRLDGARSSLGGPSHARSRIRGGEASPMVDGLLRLHRDRTGDRASARRVQAATRVAVVQARDRLPRCAVDTCAARVRARSDAHRDGGPRRRRRPAVATGDAPPRSTTTRRQAVLCGDAEQSMARATFAALGTVPAIGPGALFDISKVWMATPIGCDDERIPGLIDGRFASLSGCLAMASLHMGCAVPSTLLATAEVVTATDALVAVDGVRAKARKVAESALGVTTLLVHPDNVDEARRGARKAMCGSTPRAGSDRAGADGGRGAARSVPGRLRRASRLRHSRNGGARRGQALRFRP